MGRTAQQNKEISIKKLHSIKRSEEQIRDAELKLSKLKKEREQLEIQLHLYSVDYVDLFRKINLVNHKIEVQQKRLNKYVDTHTKASVLERPTTLYLKNCLTR